MAGYGIPEADIACLLEIDPKTLRRHYRRELDKGHIKANSRVAENLYRKATGEGREAVTAAIFWLKTRAGWKETMVQESGARLPRSCATSLTCPSLPGMRMSGCGSMLHGPLSTINHRPLFALQWQQTAGSRTDGPQGA